jgi:hypothetical protein
MKLTKTKLKQLIQEELDTMQQEGLFSRSKPEPSKEDYVRVDYSPDHPDYLLKPDDKEALTKADDAVLGFLEAAKTINNEERLKNMWTLYTELSKALVPGLRDEITPD